MNKDDYAENLWNEFKTAYDNAVKGMNDDKTTKEQADKLAADLNAAGAKLEAAEIPAPTIPEDAKATVMGVTSTSMVYGLPMEVKCSCHLSSVKRP